VAVYLHANSSTRVIDALNRSYGGEELRGVASIREAASHDRPIAVPKSHVDRGRQLIARRRNRLAHATMHDIVWNHDSGWTATTNDRQYPLASSIEPNTELMEHLRGNAVSFSKKAEKEMLRSHVRMFHRVCFFYRELEHLLRSRGVESIRALRELRRAPSHSAHD